MREVKFRVWNKEKKRMITKGVFKVLDAIENGKLDRDKFEILQYTGLRDCDRKEIYEGDIVKVIEEDGTEHIHYVEYKADKTEYPAFDLYPEIDVEFNTLQFYVINKQIEVIGNIYENPELLEENNV